MNCRHIRQVGMALAAGLALVATVSCGDAASQGKGGSYLVIDKLQAGTVARVGDTVTFEDMLRSDVLTKGTVFEDLGQVTLHAAMKDPGPDPSSPTKPTSYAVITVDRYHVDYIRSDGRSTPGVDVPYAFDGGVTGTISDSSVPLAFPIVRAQAKLEAPLMALRGLGGSMLISTIARVTFYGHDQAGNAVSITGQISVNFADWGDPD